ncbi:DNA internalization-related competence protein ComEC/Rec2 [Robertmurraya korlensis]|uniref:DNA internalization-related competence protein ComEC/Rec2 n=1 Tax=Robertmurraya korlensis TaxID=519977 RepID=UPI002040EA3E|nr:DNA internalization-related competence protein ComEC/Rec2 [Robertmurraya korlensis]MCM3599508.1 DNA internalization-related competence protein ComEC/Rec2 [Robertmurraya korlensis]
MQERWIYFALASLLALVTAFQTQVVVKVSLFLFLILFLCYKRFSKRNIFIIFLIVLVFYTKARIDINRNESVFQGSETQFVVSFQDEVKLNGSLLSGYGKDTTGERLLIKYRMKSEKEKSRLNEERLLGYSCQLTGSLKAVNGQTNPNAFDYQSYLNHQHIHWQLVVDRWSDCEEHKGPILIVKKQRQRAIELLESYFPESVASLASALLFGERQIIDPSLEKAYQKLGIIHLLAISGANVALYVSIIHYIGVRLGVTRERMIVVLLLYLPVFVYLSGASPPVFRAAMMMFLFLFLRLVSQSTLSRLDICSIIFMVYTFFSPYLLFDVGFQLSFSVTFSLLLSTKGLLKPSKFLLIKASFISQLSSLPIVLYHFYEFSLLSLLANLVYIPIFSIIINPVFITLFFLLFIFGKPISFMIKPMDFLITSMNQLTVWLASFPFQTVTIGRPSQWIILVLICTIIYLFYKWETGKTRKRQLISILPLLFTLAFSYYLSHYSFSGQITFVDVGQGDSIVIQNGFHKKTYVIDTGGTVSFHEEEWEKPRNPFEVGNDILVPFLKGKGVSTIDKLILTHGDMDHIGGARSVLETMRVEELILPYVTNRSNLENEIIQLAKEKKTTVIFVKDGMSWKENGSSFKIVNPIIEQDDRNDNSVVIHVKIGGLFWLFTGDLGEEGEERLLREYPTLRVDVLKIGHHGSKSSTSATLLQAYQPKVAVISVGETNRFGHPHQEVLDRLKERNIKIFRTDKDGAISYTFQNGIGTFSKHIPYDVTNP